MNRTRLLHLFGTVLALAALAWFVSQLLHHANSFPRFGATEIGVIGFSALAYTVPAVISGFLWSHLMHVTGEPQAHALQAICINSLSQAGKYVPGNVAHYIGRIVLAKQAGWSTTHTLFTIFIETLWAIAIGAILAILAVLQITEQQLTGLAYVPSWQILAGIACGAIMAPIIGHKLFHIAADWWARKENVSIRSLRTPPLRSFCGVTAAYLFNYLVMGWVLTLIATEVFGVNADSVFLFAGIYAAAWITGFITPGAPAGIGIREVIIVAALTPLYDENIALGIAAVLRVVTLAGDGLVFLIGLGLREFMQKSPGAT